MKKEVVQIAFTNGVGNNLFQYIYARLFVEKINGVLSVEYLNGAEYAKDFFADLGIQLNILPNPNHKLFGYFEDYALYSNHVDQIRSWFPVVAKTNKKDLVFHLRLGDRLFLKDSYLSGMKVEPFQYINVIKQFKFDRLHIVTDMKLWEVLTKESLLNMKFHSNRRDITDFQIAVDYFNSIFEALNEFDPIVRFNQSPASDFDYIRSFDQILFQHSTLAWWAAVLSKASKVGVYGPWRPCKSVNKNLSQVTIPGWFQWE